MTLKVMVLFEFDGIDDVDGEAADQAIESLEIDLKNAGIDCDTWNIEEAFTE